MLGCCSQGTVSLGDWTLPAQGIVAPSYLAADLVAGNNDKGYKLVDVFDPKASVLAGTASAANLFLGWLHTHFKHTPALGNQDNESRHIQYGAPFRVRGEGNLPREQLDLDNPHVKELLGVGGAGVIETLHQVARVG